MIDAPALAGPHHVLNVLGAERDHAADRAGAVDVRGRAAHDIDAADQFGIEEERAVGVVAGALVILPRAIDDDGDAAEILQAADVDRRSTDRRRDPGTTRRAHCRKMSDSRFGCRPWICSSVTTLTGASASMARSSVFEAATVMVSSDCTGVAPICARAFSTGAAAACASCRLRGLRLACFCFCRSDAPAASAPAVCAKPASAKRQHQRKYRHAQNQGARTPSPVSH